MMKRVLLAGFLIATSNAFAGEPLTSTVKEVTDEYAAMDFIAGIAPTPTPTPTPTPNQTNNNNQNTAGKNQNIPGGFDPLEDPYGTNSSNQTKNQGDIDLDKIIALGEKVWDFVISNKPTADYEIFKTSIVPAGITNWTQLKRWSKPISKVYRVEFKNMMGQSAGGFDYRITYFYNGSYNDKGKFIGQISVVPANIKLYTDRTMKLKVELASIINFGSEVDPVAGAQLIISWNSPTTTRYEMRSAEYMIYGTGEIEDLTNGN